MADQEDSEDARHLRAICAGRQPDCDRAYLAIDQRYRRKFNAFFRRFRRNSDDAFDLCQATFLKVIERACQFAGTGKASAWLWAIARYTLYDWPREEQPLPDRLNDDEAEGRSTAQEVPDPNWEPGAMEQRDFANRALNILGRLSPRYLEAVWLRVVLGEDYDAIDAALGKDGGNTRQFVNECMQRLDRIVVGLDQGKAPEQILAEFGAGKRARSGARS